MSDTTDSLKNVIPADIHTGRNVRIFEEGTGVFEYIQIDIINMMLTTKH